MTDARGARAAPTELPLPPGSSGWPILGETLPFISDMFGFIRKKTEEHGPVFRSSVLGNPTAIISGVEVTDKWLDENLIQREGSFPKNIQELFGGRSLPLLDGAVHHARKSLIMTGFRRDALESYLPKLEACVARALARWANGGKEILWLDELKRLAIEGICAAVFGMQPGEELDAVLDDYRVLTRGFTGLPINFPGTSYSAALKARDRILARLEAQILAHETSPTEDGLARLIAARTADGTKLSVDEMKLELHHVVIAGLIIFAEFGATIVALANLPAVHEKLAEELRRTAPTGPLTSARLAAMPYLLQVVMETKRHCPNVPVSFGRAKKDIVLGGYTVPAGWLVFMAVGENNRAKNIYTDPDTFDPDRFSPARAEDKKHVHAYVPQGAGTELGHKCAGADFSTLFMQLFTALLVRDYTYTLPAQDLTLRWSVVPPEPKDGLRAVISRR